MLSHENYMQKQVDQEILAELKRKLTIETGSIDVIEEAHIKMLLDSIETKKRIIFLLFQGDFSANEQTIKENLPNESRNKTVYDKIANKIIFNKLEKVFTQIMNQNPNDGRLISVCYDRHFFINELLSRNVDEASIKKYLSDKDNKKSEEDCERD